MITYILIAVAALAFCSILFYFVIYPFLILIECARSERSILSRVVWMLCMIFIWPFTQYFYVFVSKGPIGRRFQAFVFLCIMILSTLFFVFVAPQMLEEQSGAFNEAIRKLDQLHIPGSSSGGMDILSDSLLDLRKDFQKASSEFRRFLD